jgi:polyphenol oxidase
MFDSNKIIFGISEKNDGSMKARGDLFERDIQINRGRYFDKIGIDPRTVLVPKIFHGTVVAEAKLLDVESGEPEADALVSDDKFITLAVTVADCMSVYFFDPENNAFGIAHCGWRGVCGGILGNIVAKMADYFGTKPEKLEVMIGPHIRSCHYEVKEDVAGKFRRYPGAVSERGGKIYISLADAAVYQLSGSGVLPSNIIASDDCVYCLKDKYYSFRRDNPQEIEAMIAYIKLK